MKVVFFFLTAEELLASEEGLCSFDFCLTGKLGYFSESSKKHELHGAESFLGS
jgi:hypothetical protein